MYRFVHSGVASAKADRQRYLPASRQGATNKTNYMYSVYAIVSQIDNRIYVGLSKNPFHRLSEHNAGLRTQLNPIGHGNYFLSKLIFKH